MKQLRTLRKELQKLTERYNQSVENVSSISLTMEINNIDLSESYNQAIAYANQLRYQIASKASYIRNYDFYKNELLREKESGELAHCRLSF